MKKILITLSFIFICCGCYNYKELNDLAITSAIGIDKSDNGYKVTAQVVNTQKEGTDNNSSSDPKIIIYEHTSKTVQEAVRYMVLESPKRLYPNHMQVIIISEDVAKDGILESLDLFFRDSELQKNFYVLISKDVSANQILKTLTPADSIVSSNIKKSLESDSSYLGITELVTYDELINTYLNPNKEISLPSVTLKGKMKGSDKIDNIEQSDSSTKVVLSQMAIFKDDKMIGYLDDKQSIALSFIKGKINNTIIKYKCNGGYVVVETTNSKSSINVDNKGNFRIKISGDAAINEVSCDINLENDNSISKINKQVNKEIKKNVNNTIKYVKNNYNSDIFNFLDILYKNQYSLYKKISNDWYKDKFKDSKIDIDVNIKVVEKGNTLRVIKNEK